MPITIRAARSEDAVAISSLIVCTLKKTNAQDYPPSVIEAVMANFNPAAVDRLIASRRVLVAIGAAGVIGTASLDGDVVRTVFVSPAHQGQGIGRQLMEAIFHQARRSGIKLLKVPASITAELFYATLGFKAVSETIHGEERTIVMHRPC